MLFIYPKDWFDVNKIGLGVIAICALIVLFLNQPWWFTVLAEIILLAYSYFLMQKIKRYKSSLILVNSENQWVIEQDNQRFEVELKDYWIMTEYLFLMLKGENKSVSIMLSRRIIGAVNFSQIRTKIL